MKSLIIASALLCTQAFAHGDHDWREDYMGFLTVEYTSPLTYKRTVKPTLKIHDNRVDMNFFKEKLITLTSYDDRRSNDNLDQARSFLKKEYESIGFEVSYHPFGRGTNFIAEKKGTTSPEKVLILSSHIDSVRNKGANDNGTGTIGLLAVARVLSQKNFSYTVRILGFDKEEIGLVGSDAYVATLKEKENIIGNINFEMMGVNARKDGAFHVIDCKKENSLFLSEEIKSSIADLGLNLTVVNACTDRSDHASFWRKKIPAVVISENFFGGDADPCYHARCDIVDDRLDYTYMGNILEAVLDASERLLK